MTDVELLDEGCYGWPITAEVLGRRCHQTLQGSVDSRPVTAAIGLQLARHLEDSTLLTPSLIKRPQPIIVTKADPSQTLVRSSRLGLAPRQVPTTYACASLSRRTIWT